MTISWLLSLFVTGTGMLICQLRMRSSYRMAQGAGVRHLFANSHSPLLLSLLAWTYLSVRLNSEKISVRRIVYYFVLEIRSSVGYLVDICFIFWHSSKLIG